ncbi:MAG: hypothetical protein R2799_08355 [Crocinitomicaceae bacterium]
MSIFKKFFGSNAEEDASGTQAPPKTESTSTTTSSSGLHRSKFPFGRYTDRNKTNEQIAFWGEAVKAFDEKRYFDSFEILMKYIGDPEIGNLSYTRNGDQIQFEFIQGSNIIKGSAEGDKFVAISEIVLMETPNVPVMRKLMSQNYSLKYSKFALKNNVVCMKLSSKIEDASPNKLYYGLREMARKADREDDLLISEFGNVKEVGVDKTIPYSEEKMAVLLKYLDIWISETLEEVGKHDRDNFCGAIAFLLLRLSYRIDYLLKPQGQLMDRLEKIQHMFFAQNNETTQQRNDKIIAEFNDILNWDESKKREGLYETISTFALINPSDHKPVMDMMFDEMKKADWYINNNYPVFIKSIFEYSVAYAFFNYGMHYPTMHIWDMLMEIFNPDFYKEMGIDNQFINGEQLNQSNINKRLTFIIKEAKKEFPNIDLRVENINYGDLTQFYTSLMKEADYLNYSK